MAKSAKSKTKKRKRRAPANRGKGKPASPATNRNRKRGLQRKKKKRATTKTKIRKPAARDTRRGSTRAKAAGRSKKLKSNEQQSAKPLIKVASKDVKQPFYITTAIPYPNAPPHIGQPFELIA